ncbi:MAG: gamma-glutamyltransferase [Pseudomonadota bacterium]
MRDFALPGRSPVLGTKAMCATSHPQASRVALDILRSGGNAVDAAIAASAVLTVVEPAMTGIGGDCFALIHRPGKDVRAVNGAGCAPAGLSIERLREAGVNELTQHSAHAVTVPGAIAAWCHMRETFGALEMAQLLAPAIDLARGGFPIAARVGTDWAGAATHLAQHAGARKHFLPHGEAPAIGSVMRFPALADTLETIAREGRDGFYSGPNAEEMVATLQAMGGTHTVDDFANQHASDVTPVFSRTRGLDLYQLPPSNSGIVANLMLHILERLGADKHPPLSAKRYHLALEAARLAYAMRDMFIADPEHADVPVAHILSDGFADELAGRIDPDRRTDDLGPIPGPPGSDTIYLCVVDENGMAVSFINSVFSAFGSGIVTENSGILLHNRGQGFVLDPDHPNALAPGKRPLHTLVPAMALRDGRAELVFGVMGALFQPTGQMYVLANIYDYGMDVQEALDFPRIFFEGDHLEAEPGVPPAIVEELNSMGHDVRPRGEAWGGGQAIHISGNTGVLAGGSDPRKDGCALGY